MIASKIPAPHCPVGGVCSNVDRQLASRILLEAGPGHAVRIMAEAARRADVWSPAICQLPRLRLQPDDEAALGRERQFGFRPYDDMRFGRRGVMRDSRSRNQRVCALVRTSG